LFVSGSVAITKIYAAGSGGGMISQPATVKEIITLTGKQAPLVLYIGTATYDVFDAQTNQTKAFVDVGCTVNSLHLAIESPSVPEMRAKFALADVVLVSGGNTLFARDRWVKLGADKLFAEAMANGTVLAGGSAGGIVWFDGGHSDSMQPVSFKNPPGPFLHPAMSPAEMANWAYIRVPGLRSVPGLFCPHYDMTQDNGVLRATDFAKMLQRHSGEFGVGVDNWAAVSITGDQYTIISRMGFPGSNLNGDYTPNRTGIPAVWSLSVSDTGALKRTLVIGTGPVSQLFFPAIYITDDSMLNVARGQNPDDGKPPALINISRWAML